MEASADIFTFRPREGSFAEVRRRVLRLGIPLMILALGTGIALPMVNGSRSQSSLNTLPIVIAMVAVAGFFGLRRSILRQQKAFESYTLSIAPESLTRYQLNTPTITIARHEMKQILQSKNGALTIRGAGNDAIIVPPQIEARESLEAALSAIRPIEDLSSALLTQRIRPLLSVATLGLMAAVYLSMNKIVVGIAGVLLLGSMGWSLRELQRSKNVDHKTRRESWVSVIVILSIIGVMVAKLGGVFRR